MWGARGACCDSLPSFICFTSLSVSLSLAQSGAGGSRLTLEQGQGGKREAKQKKGGDKETRGQRASCLPFGAHGAQSLGRALSRESGPATFQTRLFIIKKQLAFLSVLCHREGGRTGRVQVRLHGLWKCPSSMTRRPWVEGAPEPWPAKWVLSQPLPGVHILDFKCERKHLQRGASSVGWQPAGPWNRASGSLGVMQPRLTDGLGNNVSTQIASIILEQSEKGSIMS